MTKTSTPRIKYRSNGQSRQIGHFDLPVPPNAEHLLPKPIRQARAKMLELQIAENRAQGAIYTTSQAIDAAQRQDATALGASIFNAQKDPGPVHLTAARAAHAEAQRKADGMAQALNAARAVYFDVVRETDRTEAVDAIEALAATELAKAEDALDTVLASFASYRGLRTLAASLALAPSVPVGLQVDVATVTRAVSGVRDEFAAMKPLYDLEPPRALTPTEADFGANAYRPPPAA